METVAEISAANNTNGTTFHIGFRIKTIDSRLSFFLFMDERNIPLTVDLRFNWGNYGPDIVIFNSLENGVWRDEERPMSFPFGAGMNTLKVEDNSSADVYNMYGNGFFIGNFTYRIPDAVINKLIITKDNSEIDHEVEYMLVTSSIYDFCSSKATSGLSISKLNILMTFFVMFVYSNNCLC